MRRLGYTRYVAQGGDVGALVTDAMGRQAPEGLLGIHLNLLVGGAGPRRPAAGGVRAGARGARRARHVQRRAASATSSSRPRGRRRSATPCWTRPSGWRPGCSTTTRTATTRSPAPSSTGSPSGNLTREQHRRQHHAVLADGHRRLGGPVVLGVRTSRRRSRPARLPRRSRSRSASPRSPARSSRPRAAGSRRSIPSLAYFNEVDRGGHFAAWEEPELFAAEVRAAFRSLR